MSFPVVCFLVSVLFCLSKVVSEVFQKQYPFDSLELKSVFIGISIGLEAKLSFLKKVHLCTILFYYMTVRSRAQFRWQNHMKIAKQNTYEGRLRQVIRPETA